MTKLWRSLDDYGLTAARAAVARVLREADAEALTLCGARDLQIDGAEGRLKARLYAPPGLDDPAPGLVFFHGGGFVVCDLETHDALCRRLAAAGRLRVLSVDYRLAPEHACPAQHLDALAAARWAFGHAQGLGVDPARIALGGDSAGAHMALWAAPRLAADGLSPRALLLLQPLLSLDDAEWSANPVGDLRVIGRLAVAYINRCLGTVEARAGVDLDLDEVAGLPPIVLVNGGPDPVRPDALRLQAALARAGTESTVLTYPGLIHGALNLTHLHELPRRALNEAGQALAARLG